ncbi:MAG: alkaline phosphatase family protein [Thermoplasmata archaeon]
MARRQQVRHGYASLAAKGISILNERAKFRVERSRGGRRRTLARISSSLIAVLILMSLASLPTPVVRAAGSTFAGSDVVTAPYVVDQSVTGFTGFGGSSAPVTVDAGDSIVVMTSVHYDTTIDSVTDSSGNSYSSATVAHSGTSDSSVSLSFWVAADSRGTSNLVVSITMSRSAPSILAVAVIGGVASPPLDTVGNMVSGGAPTTVKTTITTSTAQDLVLMGIASGGEPSVTPLGGLTLQDSRSETQGQTHETGALLSTTVPTPGLVSLSADLSTQEDWAANAIALKSNGAPAPSNYLASGTVFGSSNAPLAGASVSAVGGGITDTDVTNSKGAYQLSLPNGTYEFTVSATGYQDGYQSVPIQGTDVSNINFNLVPINSKELPGDGAIQHVVVIYLENEPISSVWATGTYEQSLAAEYGNATKFYAACHPSIPNYLASTSGVDWGCGSDAYHDYSLQNLPDLLQNAGLTWAGYFENMTTPCDTSNNGTTYVFHHNPFLYYRDIVNNPARCDADDLPATAWTTQVVTGTLLNYSFYVPNNYDDGDLSSLATADHWLKGFLTPLLDASNPTLKKTIAHTVFFVLYDESAESDSTGYSGIKGGHVFFTAVSPYSLGATYTPDATDYNLMSTIEWLFGLGSTENHDGTSEFPAMESLFQFP